MGVGADEIAEKNLEGLTVDGINPRILPRIVISFSKITLNLF